MLFSALCIKVKNIVYLYDDRSGAASNKNLGQSFVYDHQLRWANSQ